MERLARFLITKDAIESFFKLFSYLVASTVILGLAKFESSQNGWISALPYTIIFLCTVTFSFFYGLQTIVFPAGNAIWPTVNYLDTIKTLQRFTDAHRFDILSKIIFTKPAFFLFVSYILLFYGINGMLKTLIEKTLNV
jgi:flagellar biosynthesis protein FlhB